MRQFKNREKGAITIEATISLTTFVFALITVLCIVNICIVQARVSNAINLTAKELSQYSYLYSLTGFAKSEAELKSNADADTQKIDEILSDVNTMYNEIEKLGKTGNQTPNNVDDIMNSWDQVVGSAETIQNSVGSIESTIMDIAKDPKGLMFGIAKMAASETLELAKSKLIAAPLSKALCEKHLVTEEDGDVEAYLKHLGVVPNAVGSYFGGLDFSESTIFPYGSNEITVNVTYDVRVITLLNIDVVFHFNQTAITNGWLAGEASYKGSTEYVDNETLWTQSTVNERTSLIRSMVISDMQKEGYEKVSGMTNVHLYNSTENKFVTISSMNPLYTADGETPKTVDQLDDDEMQKAIEALCGKMLSVTNGEKRVNTKVEVNGSTTKKENDCTDASNKIVLVIPEDEGLKDYMETIISKANTSGVEIEVVPSYGNGATKTEVQAVEE